MSTIKKAGTCAQGNVEATLAECPEQVSEDALEERLRAKLRAVAAEADCIEAVRGLGYRIG